MRGEGGAGVPCGLHTVDNGQTLGPAEPKPLASPDGGGVLVILPVHLWAFTPLGDA